MVRFRAATTPRTAILPSSPSTMPTIPANGVQAGLYIADGVTANQTSNNSVYEGYNAMAQASGDTNEIVIGASAIGNGSNTVTLGNTSIVKTILQGNVGIGTTTPSQSLDVNGNVNIENANGILLKDTVTGTCALVQLTSGVLVPTAHACK